MTKEELKEYLVYDAEYSQFEVDNATDIELLDMWLRYNGIIGFTWDIIDVVKCLKLW